MDLHIVGGFLGSGKTTAIIGAAKSLMARGLRVGVVTNDQGRYLVDTAFFRLADVPAVEVTGGCFCCHYDDLDARLAQLARSARPDVIFAESVGSCADIVATVVKPLLTLRRDSWSPLSYSVFVDARLLRRRLLDLPMPFSDDVVYIFDKQIEEAGLLVVNKRDLLAAEQLDEVAQNVHIRFPAKEMILQNSLEAADIQTWMDRLADGSAKLPDESLAINYDSYAAGEARLAWLDEHIRVRAASGRERNAVIELVEAIMQSLRGRVAIGHVKFMIRAANGEVKLSFPALDEDANWQALVPELTGEVFILLNARAECDAATLRVWIAESVMKVASQAGLSVEETDVAFFHPGAPKPTYRMS